MGRNRIQRTIAGSGRKAGVLVSVEQTSTQSFHEAEPAVGSVVARFMAPGVGVAGPFLFRIDALQGDYATFEVALFKADERTQRLFVGRQGAGALDHQYTMRAGDRLTVTLKSIAEKAQGDVLSVKGVWTTFEFKWAEQSREAAPE
jgi:hypothetical protein